MRRKCMQQELLNMHTHDGTRSKPGRRRGTKEREEGSQISNPKGAFPHFSVMRCDKILIGSIF